MSRRGLGLCLPAVSANEALLEDSVRVGAERSHGHDAVLQTIAAEATAARSRPLPSAPSRCKGAVESPENSVSPENVRCSAGSALRVNFPALPWSLAL